ncbi:MAG: hypothetical protein ACTHZ9_12620 [Leucobacter sp.]|uniref:hypothetical protein n=1 Tax=Flaviflexus sp. TaxID=1969482 RepID=UPI003F8E876A
MPPIRGSVGHIRAQLDAGTLIGEMEKRFVYEAGHSPGASERNSWASSLDVLTADLHEAGLADVEMLLEHRLPLTSKRADFILCGANPRTGKPFSSGH